MTNNSSVKTILNSVLAFIFLIGNPAYALSQSVIEKKINLDNKRVLFLGDSITQDGTYVSFIEYYLETINPDKNYDIISIGLSSETVSGASEPTHPYARPCVHERLDRALEITKPDIVFACYGMNDGIYYPQSSIRMKAFEDGAEKFITKIQAAGAKLILLTPPIFDPKPVLAKVQTAGMENYSFAKPYINYDSVLADYSSWIMNLNIDNVIKVDLHTPMINYLDNTRKIDSTFSFSKDGVHPMHLGHLLMAREIFKGIGINLKPVDLNSELQRIESDSLYLLVAKHRGTRSAGWLKYVGYTKGETVKTDDIAPTEKEVTDIQKEIDLLRKRK